MRISTTIILFMIFLQLPCMAQPASFKQIKDTKVFLDKFNATTKNLTSIKSSFVQEKHLSALEDKIISKGIFRYKKENKVRMEYTTPFTYLMVLNNGKMYIKDGAKVNKFDTQSNKMFRQINDMLINTLNGNLIHSKEYSVKYYENESMYLIELTPLDKALLELMNTIKIYIDKNKLVVSKIEITEKSGDFTLISFFDVQQNTEIKDEEFIVK